MAYYLKSGKTFRVTSKEAMDLHEKLPVGNYSIEFNPLQGYYLDKIEDFINPKKIYGDVMENTNRIFKTFHDRPSSTGVLLCGEKGSGKSLLAKNISAVAAARENIPTLVVNAPHHGPQFNAFIQEIDQPCIVFLDEYEKVYDSESQQSMLTLLDGVYPSKKLFLLTVNDKWRVDQHMRNRPGRIFYLINYDGLDEAFIREFCQDALNNKKETNRIIQITSTFDKFNFDMLKSLVEEMNRFNESAVDAIKLLNVKPEFSSNVLYDIQLFLNGRRVDPKHIQTPRFKGNPLSSEFAVHYCMQDKTRNIHHHDDDDEEKDDTEYYSAEFTPDNLVSIDKEGAYTFSAENTTAVLTKVKTTSYEYLNYL